MKRFAFAGAKNACFASTAMTEADFSCMCSIVIFGAALAALILA